MTRGIVFAYHNVGVRCLKVLLARGVDVRLVVTHEGDPGERQWFDSVAAFCGECGIACIAPADACSPELLAAVRAVAPDMIFSFYYRQMIPVRILAAASQGAYNMHGSLLPKYRGRAPVNWAILHGESETGATLHRMVDKPDAGPIVGQTSVPILPDDIASEVMIKVTVAAEQTLWNTLPRLLAGEAPELPNKLAEGSYFGGRRPEDGCIDWSKPVQRIYNLHRAVAPPYPGAWTRVGKVVFTIGKARLAPAATYALPPGLTVVDGRIIGIGGDGRGMLVHELLIGGTQVSATDLQKLLSATRTATVPPIPSIPSIEQEL
jgi:methionyl-tRNA formyltransferase